MGVKSEYYLFDKYQYYPYLDFNKIDILFNNLNPQYYGIAINEGLKLDEIEKLKSLGYKAWNIKEKVASYDDVDWGHRYEFETYGLIVKKK